MALDSEIVALEGEAFEPLDELYELTRALRAHAEVLMSSGAWGTIASERRELPLVDVPAPSPRVPTPVMAGAREPASLAAAPLEQQTPPASFDAPHQNRSGAPPPVARAAPPSLAVARALPIVQSAEERAAHLEALGSRIAGCSQCRLHEARTQTVFARGTGSSGLCFVGEGPGADEDAQGFPFVGAAGQLLDRMISAMGLQREEVYVCNIVKCRPPDNRKPLPDEMLACRPYLEEQLEVLAPQVIVALGATAVEGLLGVGGGITRMRGTWKLYKGRVAVMPTFHPAYLLRTPSAKHAVWEDMQAVLRHMGRPIPARGKK
jgi:DNA polymerase